MSSELKTQVRFGRFRSGRRKGQRRSALVTHRVGDELFFGVSKCHKKLDRWDRNQALRYAQNRADGALKATQLERDGKSNPNWQYRGNLTVHENGTLGRCNIKDVHELLQYFGEVTEFLPPSTEELQEAV